MAKGQLKGKQNNKPKLTNKQRAAKRQERRAAKQTK